MEEENMASPLDKILESYNKKNRKNFIFAGLGILVFIVIVVTFSFQGRFNKLFPKPPSFAVGALNLTATFNSIGIEVPSTNAASATLEFKKTADPDTTWRQGLPLWQAGGSLYGSVLLTDPGVSYDIRVTPQDGAPLTGIITTRADNIPPASSLTPTHFVDAASGNDANPGTSASLAWATISKAVSTAPSGAVVQVAPGYYKSAGTRTTPITLVAKNPAVDDQRNINPNQHAVIEPNAISCPVGTTDCQSPNVWQQVQLIGPGFGGAPVGATYKVWKWTGGGNAGQLGYAQTRVALPKRVVKWKITGPDLQTSAGWAEKLYTNKDYNFGYAVFGTDIYLRLPGDLNPNSLYISAGGGNGLTLSGPNIRISGFEIRQFSSGVELTSAATFGTVDHNLINGAYNAVHLSGNKEKTPNVYGSDHLIQYNLLKDSSLWSDDLVADPNIPWDFIKGTIKNADGTIYDFNRIGESAESSGVWSTGGAHQVVIRYNTIDGYFNGVGAYNQGFDRYATYNNDINDNKIMHIGDDSFEPEQNAINWRIWNNRDESAYTFLSTGPVNYGPIYVFRNEGFNIGTPAGDNYTPAGNYFKFSLSSNPPAKLYIVNNTFWSNKVGVDGSGQYAGGATEPERFYMRNNIVRTSRYAFQPKQAINDKWNEDYNHFTTTDTTRGLSYGGNKYSTNVGAYRTASGQGTNTNTLGDFITASIVDNNLVVPTLGNLALKSGSSFIDKGVIVPNISDICGVNFTGSAPDLGAKEGISSASCPISSPSSTSAPTPSPTAISTPAPSPIASSTPSSAACSINSASWVRADTTGLTVAGGTRVRLFVVGTGNCIDKQVSFRVKGYNPTSPEGTGRDAKVQPADATFSSRTTKSGNVELVAVTSWIAEYTPHKDTVTLPQYYFNARIVGTTTGIKSVDPLSVTK